MVTGIDRNDLGSHTQYLTFFFEMHKTTGACILHISKPSYTTHAIGEKIILYEQNKMNKKKNLFKTKYYYIWEDEDEEK